MRSAQVLLFVANLVYATSYAVTRLTLDDVPPALLALVRVVGGAAILIPVAHALEGTPPRARHGDGRRMMWMGVIGFAAAFALGNWGLARSTATNAALLIIVEPVSIMLLGPALLRERLTRREAAGAVLAVLGALVVVLDGVPGITHSLVPYARGDLLLVLSGLAYGAYTLIGRDVLARWSPITVTARSIAWGAAAMVPVAFVEWLGGARPRPSMAGLAGALYLAVVITALGYLAWNWALARLGASRAAVFITLQPIGGALIGVLFLHEPITAFTVAGGALIVAGLWLTVGGRP